MESVTHNLSSVGICSAELYNRPSVVSNGMEFIGVQVESFLLRRGGLAALRCTFGLHPMLTSCMFLQKLKRTVCSSSFVSKLP